MEALIGIIVLVLALAVTAVFARKSGVDSTDSNAKSEVIDAIDKAKGVGERVGAMPADDRRDRLRKYSK